MNPSRRDFLKALPLAGLAGSAGMSFGAGEGANGAPGDLTFGFITDIHHGQFDRDQVARVKNFVSAANKRKPAFILQCGDFFTHKGGLEACKPVLDAWNGFEGPSHHVIGNHDCDYLKKDELLKAWGMPAPYYSFDAGGFHFVILDRNNFMNKTGDIVPYGKGRYGFVRTEPDNDARISITDKEQLAWLAKDLASTELPTVVFMHQPIVVGSNEGNWFETARVIDRHNAGRQRTQVLAVFAGHDHEEFQGVRCGVHYLPMMSSSYAIPFGRYLHYDEERPLFTFITLSHARQELRIEGSQSAYQGEEKLAKELKWTNPARITARTLPFLNKF